MDTFPIELPARRRRRRHSPEFRAAVIEACRQPGVSIAAVALANGLNANLLRKWVNDAERMHRHEPAGSMELSRCAPATPRRCGSPQQLAQPHRALGRRGRRPRHTHARRPTLQVDADVQRRRRHRRRDDRQRDELIPGAFAPAAFAPFGNPKPPVHQVGVQPMLERHPCHRRSRGRAFGHNHPILECLSVSRHVLPSSSPPD